MKRRIRRTLYWLSAVILAWLVITGIRIWRFGGEDYAQASDCIIVLGAAAYGTKPSPVFEERIRHAITLYRRGQASTIIFTGGRGEGSSHSESEVAAAFAIAESVSKADILTEVRSRTTRQNLVEAKALMDASGFKTAIIVSDPLHMKRATVMSRDLDITSFSSPTPTTRYRTARTKLGFLLRELYFYHHYAFFGD